MSDESERLYNLLPALYRMRDEQQGGALKALLSVVAEQAAVMEEDLARLYDDQFIETCADWVVPYIGDLIGYRALHGITAKSTSPRAEVANTIASRRRKGTVSILEQLAYDVTGWKARGVEFFQLLATTQYLNHVRPDSRAMIDLRRQTTLQTLGTAFDTVAHTADVRRMGGHRGKYNIPNIGIFLWRLRPYQVVRGTAKHVKDGCYSFHALGFDLPLFNSGQGEDDLAHLAEPVNVPEPLRRRPLYDELETVRQALADGRPEQEALRTLAYFLDGHAVFKVFRNGVEVLPQEILICDLSDWRRPPGQVSYRPTNKRADDPSPDPKLPIQVAVDPVLGRLTFPAGVTVARVEVDYCYGFSADMGGGPYERALLSQPDGRVPVVEVSAGGMTLAQAVTELGTVDGIIRLTDSGTLGGNVAIRLGPQQDLVIQAGDGTKPVLSGTITVISAPEAELTIEGLFIAEAILVTGDNPMTLALRHCTLSPVEMGDDQNLRPLSTPSLQWKEAGADGKLILDHTISGRLVSGEDVRVELRESIVDAGADDKTALAGSEDGKVPAGTFFCVRSTVIGRVHVHEVDRVENSLMTGLIHSDQKQQGCVRFSYIPVGSHVPRRFHCQPDLAITQAMDGIGRGTVTLSPADLEQVRNSVRSRMQPIFTSTQYGRPGYAQLHVACPIELRTGSDDESELGAFSLLHQNRREANLRTRFNEYLRFGMKAELFFVT